MLGSKPAALSIDRHPEARATSAFTRVHSPPKTGVNALMDALWRASKGDGPGRASFEALAALGHLRGCDSFVRLGSEYSR